MSYFDSGFKYDLSSLKKSDGYSVLNSDGHKFLINVCDNVASSKCGPQSGKQVPNYNEILLKLVSRFSFSTGACQEEVVGERSWNAGDYNGKLLYDDGVLVLNYTGGMQCHQGTFERNTVIQFVCGDSDNTKPEFITESDECTYFFVWHTKLACETQVIC